MSIETTTVNYLDGDELLECFIAYDNEIVGKRPVVLISHAWTGRDAFAENKAVELAELGYVGFALDMYGKGVIGQSVAENAALMQPFMDDRALLLQRIQAAVAAARTLPWADDKKMAAIGFCFGGLCVLDLARSGCDLKGVVSFHGLLNPPDNALKDQPKAKILILHGHDDPLVPVEQVNAVKEEFSRLGVDWQLHNYGRTLHAFTNPNANDPELGTRYSADADRRSWLSMKHFLQEVFSD